MIVRSILSAAVAAATLVAFPALSQPPKVVDETGQRVELTPYDDTRNPDSIPRRDDPPPHRTCTAFDDTRYDSGSKHPDTPPAHSSSEEGRPALPCCRR
jgi:hypothetical protein